MHTNILQQKNYSMGAGNYQLFLPMNYEVVIPENDSVEYSGLDLTLSAAGFYSKRGEF